MRAVPVIIHRIAIVIDDVDAVHIIDITIAVVINSVAGNLIGVHPHLISQLLMRVADACVDDRHQHIRGTGAHLPRLGRADIDARAPAVLARVAQGP